MKYKILRKSIYIIFVFFIVYSCTNFSFRAIAQANYPAISKLEFTIFKKRFENEDIYIRLNRLENKVFGTNFSNNSLMDRVDRLKLAIQPELSNSSTNNTNNPVILSNPSLSNSSIYDNLNLMELNFFGKTFDKESLSQRLNRIETKVFGAVQSGMTDKRLAKLNTVIKDRFIPPSMSQTMNQAMSQENQFMQDDWEKDFFNDNSFNNSGFNDGNISGTTGSTLLDIVKTIALPILFNYLDKGKTYSPEPYGYYQNNYQGNSNYPWGIYPRYIPY